MSEYKFMRIIWFKIPNLPRVFAYFVVTDRLLHFSAITVVSYTAVRSLKQLWFSHSLLQFCIRLNFLLNWCEEVTPDLQFFLSSGSRMQPLGLFSASVDSSISLLAYNSTCYQFNSKYCLKLQQSCRTFSITVLVRTSTTSSSSERRQLLSSTTRPFDVCWIRIQFSRHVFWVCGADVCLLH